jgi:hypothetical protein
MINQSLAIILIQEDSIKKLDPTNMALFILNGAMRMYEQALRKKA